MLHYPLVGVFICVLPVPGASRVGFSIASAAGLKCADIVLAVKDEEFKRKQEEENESDCSYCNDKHCPFHEERKRERERENENNRRNGY